jgi:hypothetical protein
LRVESLAARCISDFRLEGQQATQNGHQVSFRGRAIPVCKSGRAPQEVSQLLVGGNEPIVVCHFLRVFEFNVSASGGIVLGLQPRRLDPVLRFLQSGSLAVSVGPASDSFDVQPRRVEFCPPG